MSKKVERKGSFKSISGDELNDFIRPQTKKKTTILIQEVFHILEVFIRICIEENYGQ